MKKKILALCLVVVLAVTAVTGATLAYFTDTDKNTNEFGVAGLKIDLYETVDFEDGNGVPKTMDKNGTKVTGLQENLGKGDDVNPKVKYDHIMPGDKMTKKVTVKNEEEYGAYVALAIKQTNYHKFNANIDDYFEAKKVDMQAITDEMFIGDGWNDLTYDKKETEVRYYPTTAGAEDQTGAKSYVGGTETKLIAVDYAVAQGTGGAAVGYKDNMFGEKYLDANGCNLSKGYYELNAKDRIWVYYLYLPAGAEYTLDLTMVCPTEMTTENIAAFDEMKIDVQASAIQVDGFASAKAAFAELNNTYNFKY